MNREIKFRGLRTDGKGWIYGFYSGDHPFMNFSFIVLGAVEHEVKPETVSQFTGLKDSEGVDIYEGDIVESETYNVKGVVEYSGIHLNPFQYYMQPEDFKVIGNIYQNEELLK